MVRRLFTREEWGAQPPKVEYPSTIEPAERVVFTYGINTLPCRTFTECKHILQKLQRNHFRRGMSDIAYNFLIGGDGNAYEGRGWFRESSTKLKYTPGKRVDIAFIGRHSKSALPLGMLHHATDLIVTGQRKGFISRDYDFLEIINTIRYRDSKGQRSPKKENITHQLKLYRNEKTGKYEPAKIMEDRFWESPYFNELVPPGVPPPPKYGFFASDNLGIDYQGENYDDENMGEKGKGKSSLDNLNTSAAFKRSKSVASDDEAVGNDDGEVEITDDEVGMSGDESDGIVFEDENSDEGSVDTEFDADEAINNFVRFKNREVTGNVNGDKEDNFNSDYEFNDETDGDEGDFTVVDEIDYSEQNTVKHAEGKSTRFQISNKEKAKGVNKKRYSYEETILDNTNPDIDLTEAYRNSLLQKRADMKEVTRQQNEKRKDEDGKSKSIMVNSTKPKGNSKGKKDKKTKVQKNKPLSDDNISDSISDFDSDEVLRFDFVPPKSKEWLESRGLTENTDRMSMLNVNSEYKKAFEEFQLSLKKDDDIIFTDEDEYKPKKKEKPVLFDQKAFEQYKTIAKEEEEFIKKRSIVKKEDEVIENKPVVKKYRGSIKIPRKNKTKRNKMPRENKRPKKKKVKVYKRLAEPDF